MEGRIYGRQKVSLIGLLALREVSSGANRPHVQGCRQPHCPSAVILSRSVFIRFLRTTTALRLSRPLPPNDKGELAEPLALGVIATTSPNEKRKRLRSSLSSPRRAFHTLALGKLDVGAVGVNFLEGLRDRALRMRVAVFLRLLHQITVG